MSFRAFVLTVSAATAAVFAVGCGNGPADGLIGQRSSVTNLPDRDGTSTAPTTPSAAQTACAGVAAPTTLATAADVHAVQIVGSAIFYQTGTTLMRVGKDGKNPTAVYSSPNLVRAYVDAKAILAIESDDADTNATLRAIPATNADAAGAAFPEFPPIPTTAAAAGADGNAAPAEGTLPPALVALLGGAAVDDGAEPGTTAATAWNAGGTQIFASDDASFYVITDTAAGQQIVQVDKAAPGTQTVLLDATDATNTITHPQLVAREVWYVRDEKSIVKIPLPAAGAADAPKPVDLFVLDQTCSLAVSATGAYCSVGSAVERRDIDGKNPTTILDSASAKTTAHLGALFAQGAGLYVASDAPDPQVKNVIVSLSGTSAPAAQKFVACGRDPITTVAVDGRTIVWAEAKGVFSVAR